LLWMRIGRSERTKAGFQAQHGFLGVGRLQLREQTVAAVGTRFDRFRRPDLRLHLLQIA
jgi:hypothetical protein